MQKITSKCLLLVLGCSFVLFGACGCGTARQADRLAVEASQLMVKKQFEAAFQKLQRATALQPDVAEYHVGLGMAAVRLGQMSVAARQYKLAEGILAQQAKNDPERVDDYAMIVALLGKPDQAKRILKQGAERFPNSRTLAMLASEADSYVNGLRDYSISRIEPNRAANRSQPVGAQTNQASGAAGSVR